MSVLILHRDSRMLGGVEKYYQKMRDKFTQPVEFYTIGRRPGEEGTFAQSLRMSWDYLRFIVTIVARRPEVVHINPSIEPKSFVREGIFHLLARLLRCRTLIFFRGWHTSFQVRLERRLWLFRLLYGNANAYIVLSSDFKKLIRQWGVCGPVYLEVTVADDNELREFNIRETLEHRCGSPEWRILFAARVTADKGIYELIEAFTVLRRKRSDVKLIVAGDSDELEAVKQFAASTGSGDVCFTGYIDGEEKDRLFKSSHIFCMPTHYEGFPNVVVEAMAVGLPVITRAVGGLKDFFQNGVHGFITESKDPLMFAQFLEQLIDDKELYSRVSLNNYVYAQENFLASRAAARLQSIYQAIVHNEYPSSAIAEA